MWSFHLLVYFDCLNCLWLFSFYVFLFKSWFDFQNVLILCPNFLMGLEVVWTYCLPSLYSTFNIILVAVFFFYKYLIHLVYCATIGTSPHSLTWGKKQGLLSDEWHQNQCFPYLHCWFHVSCAFSYHPYIFQFLT